MARCFSKSRITHRIVAVGTLVLCVITWLQNYRTILTIARQDDVPDTQSREIRPGFFQKMDAAGESSFLFVRKSFEHVPSIATTITTRRNVTTALDLKCLHTDVKCVRAQERVTREQEGFSLGSVLPHGGNTLPNFLLRGIQQGIMPRAYRDGVLGFLHLNKAGGTTIKTCMNETIEKGILPNRSAAVISSGSLTIANMSFLMGHDVLMGDHIFGLCEQREGVNCSYFTILRDPYERALSSYYYCMRMEDQLCGPLNASNVTVQQWVLYQGSYFFYEMLMDRKYCRGNQLVADLLRYGMGDSSLVPPGARKYVSPETATSCWFKQRIYLETFVNDTGREVIVKHILDNMESWFSLIGLREEYAITLEMLSATYSLPFYELCSELVVNKRPEIDQNSDRERGRLLTGLKSSRAVANALRHDITIYEKAKEIFQRQKNRFEDIFVREHRGVVR